MTKLLAVILSLSTYMAAAAEKPVTIVSTSVSGRHVLVHIQLDGKADEMTCTRGVKGCVVPDPGAYLMIELSPEESLYTDCDNVRIYSQETQAGQRNEIGDFCVL